MKVWICDRCGIIVRIVYADGMHKDLCRKCWLAKQGLWDSPAEDHIWGDLLKIGNPARG